MRSNPICVLILLLALPASASDGVAEINQACAVQSGCFAGDTAGFPVTIDGTAGRSYRLTSDLVVPNENTSGIVISTDDVGIDLNNFAIRGPVVCVGAPLVCTPNTGAGTGIDVVSTALSGISVRNGSVRGMGNMGVRLGVQAEVTGLRVRSNRFFGISTGTGSIISANTAYQNGSHGIVPGSSTVTGNTAYSNGANGIASGIGAAVLGNASHDNASGGIAGGAGSTYSGNSTYSNGGDGISSGSGSIVTGNAAYSNTGDGITTGAGASVSDNTVRLNTGFGLNLAVQSAYRGNVITSNTAGTVTGTSLVNLGENACNGTSTCP